MTRSSHGTPWRQRTLSNGFNFLPQSNPARTEFDQLLEGIGISINDACHSEIVRAWVRRNYRSKFVPPAVLEACGIHSVDVA